MLKVDLSTAQELELLEILMPSHLEQQSPKNKENKLKNLQLMLLIISMVILRVNTIL